MKTMIAVFVVLASVADLLGQGTVDFNNHRAFQTVADRLVRDMSGDGLIGTNWCAQWYFGSDANSLSAVAARPAPFFDGLTTVHGIWFGGMRTLPGFVPGDTVTLQVRVWDGALFGSFEHALANGGIYGQSAPFSYLVPAVGSAPAFYYMENFRGFQLVPEPSSVTLLLIGAAVFWLRAIGRHHPGRSWSRRVLAHSRSRSSSAFRRPCLVRGW